MIGSLFLSLVSAAKELTAKELTAKEPTKEALKNQYLNGFFGLFLEMERSIKWKDL